MKWNANLILTCGFSELVALCTVLGWKKPHSCKDTKMATPLEFCRGMSRPVNWYRLMLRHVIRHLTNMWVCEQAIWARLSDGSFFDFFLFSRRTPRYYVLSALDFGEFKRFDGSIYRNLRKLSLFITWLGFGMTTVGTATFWLSRQIAQSLSGRNFIVWNRWKSTLKVRSIRILYSSGEILKLVAKRARDCKC